MFEVEVDKSDGTRDKTIVIARERDETLVGLGLLVKFLKHYNELPNLD